MTERQFQQPNNNVTREQAEATKTDMSRSAATPSPSIPTQTQRAASETRQTPRSPQVAPSPPLYSPSLPQQPLHPLPTGQPQYQQPSKNEMLMFIEEALKKLGVSYGMLISICIIGFLAGVGSTIGPAAVCGVFIGLGFGIAALIYFFNKSTEYWPAIFPVVIGPTFGLLAGAFVEILRRFLQ